MKNAHSAAKEESQLYFQGKIYLHIYNLHCCQLSTIYRVVSEKTSKSIKAQRPCGVKCPGR